jgi:transcriptional regulator with XRE-family HTH domain
MPNLVLLGRVIQLEREEHDMTPAELAAAARVEPGRLAELEAGRLNATYLMLVALADGLGVRPSALLRRFDALKQLLEPGEERLLTPEEFEEHFGHLPTDGEG